MALKIFVFPVRIYIPYNLWRLCGSYPFYDPMAERPDSSLLPTLARLHSSWSIGLHPPALCFCSALRSLTGVFGVSHMVSFLFDLRIPRVDRAVRIEVHRLIPLFLLRLWSMEASEPTYA